MSEQLSPEEKQRRIDHWYGYVYLLKCGDHYKIGQSKKPRKRLKQLRTGSPLPIRVIHTLRTSYYREIERDLHRRFADKRAEGEWFLLADDDVAHIKSLDRRGWTPEEAAEREALDEQYFERLRAERQSEEDKKLAVLLSGAVSGAGLCLSID